MATGKLTVTVDASSIRKLDRWVRQGRYPNRSQATQAALDLLERRNALPTLAEALAAYRRRQWTPDQQAAYERELQAIDATLDRAEPPLPPSHRCQKPDVQRGTICYTTIAGGGLGHDQGTRPVLVVGRTEFADATGETIVLSSWTTSWSPCVSSWKPEQSRRSVTLPRSRLGARWPPRRCFQVQAGVVLGVLGAWSRIPI